MVTIGTYNTKQNNFKMKHLSIVLFCFIIYSCTIRDSHLDDVFSRHFPSDKITYPEDITYEKNEGYYFVRLKMSNSFNLVCKESELNKENCIDTWGFINEDEFLILDSIIKAIYTKGLGIAMISKEDNLHYLIRETKNNTLYKDLTLKKTGNSYNLVKEKLWNAAQNEIHDSTHLSGQKNN